MGVPAETRAQSNATLWLLVAAVGLVTALLAGTAVSIVSIWHRSNTFGHGFLIPPIAAWLVWRRRSRIRAVPVRPCPWCLVGVALLGFAWFWGRLASVLILEQFAFALLIPATIAAVLGTAMLRALLFPLAFLMLGVPAGDALAVPLIEFTMSFTVKALQLSGVPVVRTGSFLTLPNGEWLVSDACSGFRYLVASFTLGCLYAHLKYRTWRYRLLFVALSLAIPIVANGVRAFLIVMLGYLSDMKLAMGVDHFIYGWVLFALFCLLLFWIGSRLREPAPPPRPGEPTPVDVRARAPVGRLVATAAAALLAVGIWPAAASRLDGSAMSGSPSGLELPAAFGPWMATDDPISLWRPDYRGAAAEAVRSYRRGARVVGLYVAYYRHQKQGSELINSVNRLVSDRDPDWRRGWERERSVPARGRVERVWETHAEGPTGNILLWHRFWVQGRYTQSPSVAMLLELRGRMFKGKDDAALVVMLAPYAGTSSDGAAAALQDFLSGSGPALDALLIGTAARP